MDQTFKLNGFIFVLLSILVFCINALAQENQKNILALYSYDATFDTYKESNSLLDDIFPSIKYSVDVEFLDSKRYPSGELNRTIFERINIKQHDFNRYDLVVAANDNALRFCIKHQEELFKQTPIVFWGVNDVDLALKQDSNHWISGFYHDIKAKDVIGIIQQVHPNNDGFIVITDNTYTAKSDLKTFSKAATQFPGFKYDLLDISRYDLAEYTKQLESINTNKVILILSALKLRDGFLSIDESNTLHGQLKNHILYSNFKIDSSLNFAGGRMINHFYHAYPALLLGKQVLEGTQIGNAKVTGHYSSDDFVLNVKRLSELNVNIASLPEDVPLVNLPDSMIKLKKKTIYTIVMISAVLLLIMSIIIYLLWFRQKLERSLRIDAENYSNIFINNHSVMLIIDPETQKIVDANKAASRFYGYRLEEFKKLKISGINDLPEIDLKNIFRATVNKNIQVIEKHTLKNGESKDVEVHAGKIEINKKLLVLEIVNDISQRMQFQNEIIRAKQKAEESDQLKSAFLANMSHEIRTPMNSILGFSSLLAEDGYDFRERNEFLNHIQSNGEHLLSLINDIIDISKIEANQMSINIGECRVNALLDDLYSLFKNRLKEKSKKKVHIELTKGVKKDNYCVKTDEIRLKQVLMNLLENAMKFTDSGTIQFGYKFREDSVLQFFVKDTGIGIPEEKQKTIFTVFEQVEDFATRNYGGTGLGLSICKSLVEKLGGHIWVVSELGEGSRFYFTISATSNLLSLN